MTDKNLVVVNALYKHWLSPSSYITVSSEPRLYNPMRSELLVNSHINGTTIYVCASMVGSHNLIPFSPIRTMIPQVFLNRVSHHNWNTWLEKSLTKFPQISIHYQRYLHQSIKHVQRIFNKEKLKHHYEKWFRIINNKYDMNLCNQNLSYMKDLVEKNITLSTNKCFMTKPLRS